VLLKVKALKNQYLRGFLAICGDIPKPNVSAKSLNAKIKAFRSQFRGV
jgi:hypothetical protein